MKKDKKVTDKASAPSQKNDGKSSPPKTGYIPVPPECHDETLVTVKLLLMDERRNELSFGFGVRVDRSVMRKCERQQRERRAFAQSTKGGELFEPKRGQSGDQKSVSPGETLKQPRASGKHGATNLPVS
jgi:hypothetical protein